MVVEIAMKKMVSTRVGQIGLFPTTEMGDEDLQGLPRDKELLVTARSPRNTKQFKLAWALAKKVSDACDFLQDSETAMDWLKIKARHVKMIQDPRTGIVSIIPKSIAFASLSQDAFKRVLDRMIFVTVSEIIPGLDEGKLRAELLEMVGA